MFTVEHDFSNLKNAIFEDPPLTRVCNQLFEMAMRHLEAVACRSGKEPIYIYINIIIIMIQMEVFAVLLPHSLGMYGMVDCGFLITGSIINKFLTWICTLQPLVQEYQTSSGE